MSILPPLPDINDADIIMDLYTHPSLRASAVSLNSDYGDIDRLAQLGHKILDLADLRRFFDAYVGALYIREGGATVQQWISRLIDPEEDNTPGMSWVSPTTGTNLLPDQYQSSPTMSSGHFLPMQPSSPPPPLPHNNVPVATRSLVTLALMNQTAAQRGRNVTYMAEHTGPPHMPIWTVQCLGKRQNIDKNFSHSCPSGRGQSRQWDWQKSEIGQRRGSSSGLEQTGVVMAAGSSLCYAMRFDL
ncbi:hypothetical protein H0H93_004936 [Arthromyces matolae]|nr:hypothetical protein H0H93_004936 [Arthromyces matolae]